MLKSVKNTFCSSAPVKTKYKLICNKCDRY